MRDWEVIESYELQSVILASTNALEKILLNCPAFWDYFQVSMTSQSRAMHSQRQKVMALIFLNCESMCDLRDVSAGTRIIEKPWPDVLKLPTTFNLHPVAHNFFWKAKMRQLPRGVKYMFNIIFSVKPSCRCVPTSTSQPNDSRSKQFPVFQFTSICDCTSMNAHVLQSSHSSLIQFSGG